MANNGVPWCYTANGYGTCAESCNSCTCNSGTGKILFNKVSGLKISFEF